MEESVETYNHGVESKRGHCCDTNALRAGTGIKDFRRYDPRQGPCGDELVDVSQR